MSDIQEQLQYLMEHAAPVLSTEDEREIFYELQDLTRRIEALEKLANRNRSQGQMLRHDKKRRDKIRQTIVHANFGLVIEMTKKTRVYNVDFDDLVSEGLMILTRSVDRFDVDRGIKFSTYACRGILNGFARMGLIRARKVDRLVTDHELTVESKDDAGQENVSEEIFDLRDALNHNLAKLSEDQQVVVRMRYGLDDGEPKKLKDVAPEVGLTIERVRQLQAQALAQLRFLLDDSPVTETETVEC